MSVLKIWVKTAPCRLRRDLQDGYILTANCLIMSYSSIASADARVRLFPRNPNGNMPLHTYNSGSPTFEAQDDGQRGCRYSLLLTTSLVAEAPDRDPSSLTLCRQQLPQGAPDVDQMYRNDESVFRIIIRIICRSSR